MESAVKDSEKVTDPQSAPVSEPKTKSAPKTHTTIIIASNGEDKGDVFASNGQGGQILLQRDVECRVPVAYLHTLRLAVNEVYQTDAVGSIIGQRSVPRFNITVVE